jgi:Arc/MetJ-type ribon-helix-helix transcriptional regulator
MLARGDVKEEFCQDLKSYLEEVLLRRRTHVVVRVGRLVKRREKWQKYITSYSIYLRQLFGEYRFAKGIYMLPREVAEDTYKNIDALCETLKKIRKREREETKKEMKRETEREKMVRVSFHITPYMLKILDEVARITGKTRAEIVREAVRQMLQKMASITSTSEEKDVLDELVRHGVYSNVEDAIRDIAYQIAQLLYSA